MSRLSPRDAARLHSSLRAAQVNVVASRMKWAALLKETDTVRESSWWEPTGACGCGVRWEEREMGWKTMYALIRVLCS